MAEKSSLLKLAAVTVALGLAFWLGRASTSNHDEGIGTSEPGIRSTTRAPKRHVARVVSSGVGQEAVTSAADLRDFFKRSGGNFQRGTSEAKLALAAMNGPELSRLVHDLAVTQADSPGYSYLLEIQTACSRWAQVDPEAAIAFAQSSRQQSFRSTALRSMFNGLAEIDPNYAKQLLTRIHDPALRKSMRSGIISSMAMTHPDAWLAEVKLNPSIGGNMISAVSEWAVDDPAATATRIKQLPKSLQRSAITTLGAIWAGKDPQSALSWARSLDSTTDQERALSSVAGSIAAKDPDRAMTLLSGLRDAGRRAGIAAVFRTLIDRDFDGAMNRALALTDEKDKAAAINAMLGKNNDSFSNGYVTFMSGPSSNAEQVHKLISRLPEGTLRNGAINSLAQRLAHYPPADAEALFAGYSEEERITIKQQMITTLSYSSPKRALELYQSLPEEKRQAGTFSNIVNYLSRRDPDTAIDLALQATDKNASIGGISTAFRYLTTNDPEAAVRRLESIPEGDIRDSAIYSLVNTWGRQDPEQALKWADGLAEGARETAMCNVLGRMASTDPENSAKALADLLKAPTGKHADALANATQQLMASWGRSDPESAATWVGGLSNEQSRARAVGTLASQWMKKDMAGASQWLESLPDGKARDAGVFQIVYVTQSKNPSTAFAWANSLSDQHSRYSQISQTLRYWKKIDPAKARAAVRQANVSDRQRENLLRNLQ